jgi:hypothetical protein
LPPSSVSQENHGKKKILLAFVILALVGISFLTWLHWRSIGEGQSTLHAYPIILNPDGSGTSSILEHIDKSLIGYTTHLTDKDLSQYPAIDEAITGKRYRFRGFLRWAGWIPVMNMCLPGSISFPNMKGSLTSFLCRSVELIMGLLRVGRARRWGVGIPPVRAGMWIWGNPGPLRPRISLFSGPGNQVFSKSSHLPPIFSYFPVGEKQAGMAQLQQRIAGGIGL